jgi:uncharacterized protein (TIGR03435 family)
MVAVICAPSAIRAQGTPRADQKPTFEVVSVKLNPEKVGRERWRLTSSSGRLSAGYITVQSLIWNAYGGILRSQVMNAPSWTDSDHFDVEATGSPITSAQQLQSSLQALLADRFKLVVHHETRDLPTFSLVLARRDESRPAKRG